MHISVIQENLAKALNNVIKAIESRPPLPVLANILLVAEDSRLQVTASNLQMSITVWIGARVDRPGSITLPAKTFSDLVGRLAKDRVDLRLDEITSTVHYECGATKGTIKGIAATEYPPVKQSDEAGITLPAKTLKSMIVHTAFAAAKEDNRPILTGVYVHIDKDVLTFAAADGYRLAVRTTRLDEVFAGTRSMVIPAKTMFEVARLIEDENQAVSLSLPDTHNIVTFRLPNIDISSQILEGRFPDFAAIIPQRYTTRAVAPTLDWLKKCQIAEIFARDDAHSGFLSVKPSQGLPGTGTPSQILIAGRSAERGNSDNAFEAQVEGDGVEAHFDIRLLIEMFGVVDEECVVFENNGPDSPGVWKIEGRDDFAYAAMPMTR